MIFDKVLLNESIYNVKLPDGTVVMITYFPEIGAGVSIYENTDDNPIVSYIRKPLS